MAQLGSKLRTVAGSGLAFWCPGCGSTHVINIGSPGWTYDGNSERPTFSPSVLVRSGHYATQHAPSTDCWCTFNAKRAARGQKPSVFKCSVCHSFVRDGKIQFLDDCTHALAGQTVDLPDLPPEYRD